MIIVKPRYVCIASYLIIYLVGLVYSGTPSPVYLIPIKLDAIAVSYTITECYKRAITYKYNIFNISLIATIKTVIIFLVVAILFNSSINVYSVFNRVVWY